MTAVRFAVGGNRWKRPQGTHQAFVGEFGSHRPSLLVSYFYWNTFAPSRAKITFKDYVLDSGAFSAHNSGKHIDLSEFIDFSRSLLANDPKLAEVYALDVIGDAVASARNCEEMNRQGVPALPTFHLGSPFDMLEDLASKYPKVALGGMVGAPKGKVTKFIEQCFARVWPKKLHAFGVASPIILSRFPFHSADSSCWEVGPTAYGRWRSYNGNMSVRGGDQKLRPEIDWQLKLEQKLQAQWAKQMEQLKP